MTTPLSYTVASPYKYHRYISVEGAKLRLTYFSFTKSTWCAFRFRRFAASNNNNNKKKRFFCFNSDVSYPFYHNLGLFRTNQTGNEISSSPAVACTKIPLACTKREDSGLSSCTKHAYSDQTQRIRILCGLSEPENDPGLPVR